MTKTNEKVEIKKIVLQLGKIKADLTIEQAKKLQQTLNDLFGTTTTTVVSSPIIIEHVDRYSAPYRPERPFSPFIWAVTDKTQFTTTNDVASFELDAGKQTVLCSVK